MIHHWNKTDINKLIVKLVHLIDIDEDAVTKANLQAAKIHIGCDNVDVVPSEFHAVIGNQLCKINIKIISKIVIPRDLVVP